MEMKYNGVRIYCLPDDNFCLKDEEHRSPLELDECPLGEDACTGDCFYQLRQSTTSIGYNPVIPHGRG